MATTKKASKAGAARVTANLDALATLFQHHHASLGIPQKVAMDMAYRLDLVSDSIDRRKQAGYFDPSEIGTEKPGPLMYDDNNPFMAGHFTQERFDALDEKQVSGELAANAAKHVADPKLASLVRQAAYAGAMGMATKMRAAKKADDEAEEPAKEAKKSEEEPAKEAKKSDDAEKEAKTAALAAAYNKLRREVSAGEDKKEDPKPEDKPAEKSEDKPEADEEAKKTAKAFGLFG